MWQRSQWKIPSRKSRGSDPWTIHWNQGLPLLQNPSRCWRGALSVSLFHLLSIVKVYFSDLDKEYSALSLTSVTGKQPEKFSSKFVSTFGKDPIGGGCVRGRCSKVQLGKPESQTSQLKFCFLQTKILLFKTDWHQLLKICIIEQRFLFE